MRVTYDEDGDVLYVTISDEPAHNAEEKDGMVWRYAADKAVIGVTCVDFVTRLTSGKIVRMGEPT